LESQTPDKKPARQTPGLEKEDPTIFDEQGFRASLGDAELMRTVLLLFPEEIGFHERAIRQSLATGDAKQVHAATHALVGMIGNYWAPRCYQQARALDHLAREARLPEAAQSFDACLHEMKKLAAILSRFAQSLDH
jgi:HPt (histidine-containing phosphotransfer) domain-containing protein